jgi:hypothetical protein
MKEDQINEEQIKKEFRAIRLMLAYLCIPKEPEASLIGKVDILDRFGLSAPEIAKVCKSSRQSILNARQMLKKKPHAKKKKPK